MPDITPGGAPDEGTQEAGSKQRALLEAAARIVADEGPERLSIRRLATEVGTSTMAVYTWYGSKANLLRAVFREAFQRFRHQLEAEPSSDPLADLVRLGWAYRRYALDNPSLYRVMFGLGGHPFELEPEDVELAIGTYGLLVVTVRRCVEAGRLRGDVAAGAWQLWAAVHGAMSLGLSGDHPAGATTEDGAYRGLLRTLLLGLGADPVALDEVV